MAIIRRVRKNGIKYQVKVRGSDGFWISKTFDKKTDAKEYNDRINNKMRDQEFVSSANRKITLNEYWEEWNQYHNLSVSAGWKRNQKQMFEDYIKNIIGHLPVVLIRPAAISKVIANAKNMGRASQTIVHIYNLLHKMFEDAWNVSEYINRNPVLKQFKPKIPIKETKHLSFEEVKKLLEHVRGKSFELSIWLGVVAGLRVGEIEALKWENVDLNNGYLYVRSTYCRKEHKLNQYPKGKKWFDIELPRELLLLLRNAKIKSIGEFVVSVPENAPYKKFYDAFLWRLRKYCRDLDIPMIGTHGLRHSAASLYMEHGASERDMQTLFAHSSSITTKRYIHSKNRDRANLGKVVKAIRILDDDQAEEEKPVICGYS